MRAPPLLTAGLLLVSCARKQHDAPELQLPALRVVLASESEIRKIATIENDVVRRPWVGPIIQLLAEDAPDGAVPVPQKRLAGSANADALFARALTNLRAAIPQPIQERTVQMAKARVQITRFADSYTTARLLLPDLWSPIAANAGGQLFAAAPARDILLWTTSLSREDQRALRAQAQTAFESRSYPISPAILRWTGTGWALEDPNPRN